jgi:hypothetical protein
MPTAAPRAVWKSSGLIRMAQTFRKSSFPVTGGKQDACNPNAILFL